jgi:uncharacterized damage-inducible protein DinB
MSQKISAPTSDEYAESYADYIQRAQARGDVLDALSSQIDEIKSVLSGLSDVQALVRDAPREWSIKEIVGHLCDVERVFSYRLLRIARNDGTPLAGFDQDNYVQEAKFDQYALQDLLTEFEYLRRADISMIQKIRVEASERRGTASGCIVSARALMYMLVGHVEHHMASLHEKYLPIAITR